MKRVEDQARTRQEVCFCHFEDQWGSVGGIPIGCCEWWRGDRCHGVDWTDCSRSVVGIEICFVESGRKKYCLEGGQRYTYSCLDLRRR